MGGVRGLVLGIRFLCELGLLVGLAYCGFTIGSGALAWVLGVGAPVVAAVVWGTFVSPKARHPVSMPIRLSIEIDLFIVTAIALWFADALAAGVTLAFLGISTSVLNVVTEVATDDEP